MSYVLIIDDSSTTRLYYREILEGVGFGVEEAINGIEGLEKTMSQSFDLILVDLNMPGLDGYGVLRGVRQSLGLASLPILMLTADADDGSQARAFELGADDYIVKPVKVPLVVARVKAAFRRLAL